MVKIIDRRNIAMGGGSKRKVSNITQIAIHYSATATGNSSSFENFWKNSRGWVTGGYHEVVLLDGTVELNYNANVISNGVLNHNSKTYNMCYVGAGAPNKAQRETLVNRIAYNKKRLNVSNSNIKGHREFSGQSTSCPAVNVATLVSESDNKPATKPASKPASKPAASSGGSIVDYLKGKNRPSSYAARKTLAIRYGIRNYKGTESQNLRLLNLVKGSEKPASKNNYSNKRLESKVNGLRFYNKRSWQDKDVIGRVNRGYGFPIVVRKHKVGNGEQYQVRNSKGATFYITASNKYVSLKNK